MKVKELRKQKSKQSIDKYINRSQAIRKLQLPISQFRKLCILKGIYPVEPTNKQKSNNKSTLLRTFYHKKDIQFLAHEPIINTLRLLKSHSKKEKKAYMKTQSTVLENLINTRPKYLLNHLIQERYPSYESALADLSDALSIIALYANLPTNTDISVKDVRTASLLLSNFKKLVIKLGLLTKTFISIKGFYYQVVINSLPITWIEPFKFTTTLPVDVDFKIMSTFLEINSSLLGFVNYKLALDSEVDIDNYNQVHGLDIHIDSKGDTNKHKLALDSKVDTNNHIDSKVNIDKPKKLFSNLIFYISREVPEAIIFVIEAFGGLVGGEDCTHYITERDVRVQEGVIRVQPQWVYDSCNFLGLLRVDLYAINSPLPPHLSPFYQAYDSPIQQQIPLSNNTVITNTVIANTVIKEESDNDVNVVIKEESDNDVISNPVIKEESDNDVTSNVIKEKSSKEKSGQEVIEETGKKEISIDSIGEDKSSSKKDHDLRKMMMSKKNKKLYEKMQFGKERKAAVVRRLYEKKALLSKK